MSQSDAEKSLDPTEIETKSSSSKRDYDVGQPINIGVNAQNLNFHSSDVDALARVAEKSPEVAMSLINASKDVAKYDEKKFRTGAITAAVIACSIICVSGLIISLRGFLPGIAFFLCCATVSAIISAVFTGKSQDLSWTVGMVKASRPQDGDKD